MSGIGHAISKVFKGAVSLVKKVWKPLVIAAAIYFTGGLAGAWALPGAAAAEGGAAALGAGAADLGGAGVLTAEGAAAAGIGGDAAGAAGLGLTDWGAAAGASGLAGTAAAAAPVAATAAGAPSSLWSTSLGVAKSVLGTPGVPSLIGGLAQGLMAGNLQNAQFKWQEAHAPGQVAGGVPKDAFAGFAANKNLTPATPNPTAQKLPQFTPYNQPAQQVPIYQVGAQPMPGTNEPGPYTGIGGQWPGYGVPGYGQQYPPGYVPPGGPQPPGMLLSQQGLLGQTPQQMPFIESPYDESYA